MKSHGRFRNAVELMLVGLAFLFVPFLPRRAVVGLARRLGSLAYRLAKRTRRLAIANLEVAFGSTLTAEERESVARSAFQTFGLTLLDLFWFRRFTRSRVTKWVRFDASLDPYFEGGAMVAVTAHFGNWEVMGLAAAAQGKPPVSVAAPLMNPAVDAVLLRERRRTGQEVVPREGAAKALIRALRAGRSVAVLLDQNTHPRDGGIFVPFFGRPVPVSRVPAALAIRTGAPVTFCFCVPDRRGAYTIYGRGPSEPSRLGVDEETVTRSILAAIEAEVRQNPQFWLWMYKRWKLIPDGESADGYPYYARPFRVTAERGVTQGDI
jgi:KDO2-lipid IV(A) lauroyltransferase